MAMSPTGSALSRTDLPPLTNGILEIHMVDACFLSAMISQIRLDPIIQSATMLYEVSLYLAIMTFIPTGFKVYLGSTSVNSEHIQ